jgi:hypothetical protein
MSRGMTTYAQKTTKNLKKAVATTAFFFMLCWEERRGAGATVSELELQQAQQQQPSHSTPPTTTTGKLLHRPPASRTSLHRARCHSSAARICPRAAALSSLPLHCCCHKPGFQL